MPPFAASPGDLHLPAPGPGVRVAVAMSGGVDSSVVAALLAEAGYEVVGLTLQLYDHGRSLARKGACCAGADIHDARRVAARLGIAHYVLDYERRFAEAVIDDFADSYLAGETPVPCVRCNERVKFRDLLATARDLGAVALATGHYIASRPGGHGFELHQPADRERDQSYFLFSTTRAMLADLRFPLGGLRKAEVRELARRLELPVADKADSQDICFVPSGRYQDLIGRLRPGSAGPGEIVHLDGRVIGRHDGIINFTIGQRRGVKVSAGEPLFVVRIEADSRRVVVGPRAALSVREVVLRDVNWLGDGELADHVGQPLRVAARIRSSGPPVEAVLRLEASGAARVELCGEVHGVSPGQACVLYGDAGGQARVLGGGWIASALPPRQAPAVLDQVAAG